MKILNSITEDEMIAVFLKGEFHSDIWGETIRSLLEEEKLPPSVIDSPDFDRLDEKYFRKKFLAQFRGYEKNELLFHTFPKDVSWKRVIITQEELSKVLYTKWDYWLTITNGSRLPKDAVRVLLQNPQDEDTKRFWKIAEAIKAGTKFPELILVTKDTTSPLVILESHVRLTAYFMVPDYIPKEIQVIIGFSNHITTWENY